MKEAFSQIGTIKEGNNKYMMVWNCLEYVIKKANSELRSKNIRISCIKMLAGELMRRA